VILKFVVKKELYIKILQNFGPSSRIHGNSEEKRNLRAKFLEIWNAILEDLQVKADLNVFNRIVSIASLSCKDYTLATSVDILHLELRKG